MKRSWLYGRALLALTLSTGLLVAGLSSDSSSAGASTAPIKIGLVTTLSGPIAPTFADAVAGAQARIGLQNAEGGVNGHKLELITADDGGTPTTALTAIQSLASKGVTAIISQGLFFFAGAPYVNTQGIPVIGAAQDGTEWAQYKNMFGIFGTPAPGYPVDTSWGQYLKSHGGTKLAVLASGQSPTSVAAAKGVAESAKKAGVDVAYENLTLPLAPTDFGPIALAMKNAGANAFYAGIAPTANLSLVKALEANGVTLKVALLVGGVSQSLLSVPGLASYPNLTVIDMYAPPELHTSAVTNFLSAMRKYANFNQVPDIFAEGDYMSADLIIQALKAEGTDQSKIISYLRSQKAYTGAGLEPAPLNLTEQSGQNTVPGTGPGFCWYAVKIVAGKASMEQNTPICGKLIPNSDTASPSS